MDREEQHQKVHDFLCEREKSPLRFDYTQLSEPYCDNPLMYIAGDGDGLQDNQMNVCIDSSTTLKYQFRLVKFPELTGCDILWYRKGRNDESEWYLIGRHTNADWVNEKYCYFFMTAWCDYTGFDCQGEIRFYLSHTLKGLLQYGITDAVRQLILTAVP